jgi:hypothetical protein
MKVAVPVIWPIVGLVISAYVLHRLRLRTVGMLDEVVVHYHAPPRPCRRGRTGAPRSRSAFRSVDFPRLNWPRIAT